MSNKAVKSEKVVPHVEDPDNPVWTEEELKSARPGKDVFKELGITPPRPRGRPPVDTPKQTVTIRLDADLLENLRASGKGWQSRVNKILRNEVLG
jgi:uncharacterized protein (DUF4415 family)